MSSIVRGLALIVAASIPLACLHAEQKPTGAAVEQFRRSSGWQKLDPRFQTKWRDAMESGEPTQRMECFLKVPRRLSPKKKRKLAAAGFAARAEAGAILTGSV